MRVLRRGKKRKKDIPGILQSSTVPTARMEEAEVGESSAVEWRNKDTSSELAPISRGMRESLTNEQVGNQERNQHSERRERRWPKKEKGNTPTGWGTERGQRREWS